MNGRTHPLEAIAAWLLALLALVALVIKSVAEWRQEQQLRLAADLPPERPHASAAGTPT